MAGKGNPKTGGRQKGTPNKVTSVLKDAILAAAEEAGGDGGLAGYLRTQAIEHPGQFMTLLGKILPRPLSNAEDEALKISIIERIIVNAQD